MSRNLLLRAESSQLTAKIWPKIRADEMKNAHLIDMFSVLRLQLN